MRALRPLLPCITLLTRSNSFHLHPKTNSLRHHHHTSTTSLPMRKPYGTWPSPITSKSITSNSVKLQNLHYDPSTNSLYWIEGRPQQAGRNALVRYDPSSKQGVDVTGNDVNVRTRVHEYGGGSVVFGKGGDSSVYYSDFISQNLCRLDGTAVTKGEVYRYADGVLNQDESVLYCVREDHTNPKPAMVVNEIVAISIADGNVQVIATGNDFYSNPRLSPDGKQLAYITWNHPNMPWDATSLHIVDLSSSESNNSKEHECIAGQDGDTSVLQPLWHPDGTLYYISDEGGYYNIYREGMVMLEREFDFGGSAPGWTLGQQGFHFLPDGRLVAQYTKNGISTLVVAQVSNKGPPTNISEYDLNHGLPMMFGGITPGTDNDLYFIGGSPSTPPSIYKWNLDTQTSQIIKCSSDLSFDTNLISIPRQIQYPTTLGTAYGYYYPPKNGECAGLEGESPPLLVKAHGGPTACTGTSFNPAIQFWTSRGFAILDVDYGGSTGYGREYRRRLRKNWGVVDIDDVCAGAQYLVKEGLADGERLCIDGGSAGGYTTLGALAFRDVFKAGTSLYGIGDLTALAGDTHKFESRYLDGLIGAYPEEEKLYKERSPIESVDTLSCPILLLQGDEDKVVPPNQAKMMHEALLKKGLPTCLKIYEGEQHGFRKAENIEDALDSELAFYGKVFGFDVPGAIDIKVDNM